MSPLSSSMGSKLEGEGLTTGANNRAHSLALSPLFSPHPFPEATQLFLLTGARHATCSLLSSVAVTAVVVAVVIVPVIVTSSDVAKCGNELFLYSLLLPLSHFIQPHRLLTSLTRPFQ